MEYTFIKLIIKLNGLHNNITSNIIITMNLFELLYVCIKHTKAHEPNTKRDHTIDNLNVLITNERITEVSLNYSESCNSIMSELSTIDEE
jgi:hypothetical protein